MLPECEVVSIAYANSRWNLLAKRFNNSELLPERIGSEVAEERVSRFRQVYGDSHQLDPSRLVADFGTFDLVFIDGDHSRSGVRQDTELALSVIDDRGVICWHDANPKRKYAEVRAYLEQERSLFALATTDDYIGGIACWSRDLEARVKAAAA